MSKVWTGGTSSDPTVDANWTGTLGDSNLKPVDNDKVIVPAETTRDMDGGSGLAGVKVASWVTHAGSRVKIGSAGTPLEISAARFEHYGGELFLKDGSGVGEDLDLVIVGSAPGKLVTLTGTIAKAIVARGNVNFDGSIAASIAELHIEGTVADTIVQLESCGNANTDVFLGGGRLTSHNQITNMRQTGGIFEKMDTNTITLLDVKGGQALINEICTITHCHSKGGVVDPTRKGIEVTITNLYRYLRGDTKINRLITVTNEFDMREVFSTGFAPA